MFLLVLAVPGCPGERAIKGLFCCCWIDSSKVTFDSGLCDGDVLDCSSVYVLIRCGVC